MTAFTTIGPWRGDPRQRRSGAPLATTGCAALLVGLAACGGSESATLVRGADDVQVMTPEQVAEVRLPLLTTVPPGTTMPPGTTLPPGSTVVGDTVVGDTVVGDTVPQNQDDRPPELRLFEAFGKFRSCLEDKGFQIEGDLLDPNNPAYQEPGYLDAVQTCAARTDIVSVLQEVQSTRASLTPEEVEERNEVFKELQDVPRGRRAGRSRPAPARSGCSSPACSRTPTASSTSATSTNACRAEPRRMTEASRRDGE